MAPTLNFSSFLKWLQIFPSPGILAGEGFLPYDHKLWGSVTEQVARDKVSGDIHIASLGGGIIPTDSNRVLAALHTGPESSVLC